MPERSFPYAADPTLPPPPDRFANVRCPFCGLPHYCPHFVGWVGTATNITGLAGEHVGYVDHATDRLVDMGVATRVYRGRPHATACGATAADDCGLACGALEREP